MASQREQLYAVEVNVLNIVLEWNTSNPRDFDSYCFRTPQNVKDTGVLPVLQTELPERLKNIPISEKQTFTSKAVRQNEMKPLS
jgi:hypothetical protein